MVALDVNTKYLILGAFVILLDLWAGGRWRPFRCFMYIGSWIPNQNMNGYSEHHMPLHTVHIQTLVQFLTPKTHLWFSRLDFQVIKNSPPSVRLIDAHCLNRLKKRQVEVVAH